jgi:hypothetical protein
MAAGISCHGVLAAGRVDPRLGVHGAVGMLADTGHCTGCMAMRVDPLLGVHRAVGMLPDMAGMELDLVTDSTRPTLLSTPDGSRVRQCRSQATGFRVVCTP